MQTLICGGARLGINFTEPLIRQFQLYYDLLTDWNQRMNLTAIVEYNDVQANHFLDSLSILLAVPDHIKNEGADLSIMDVGTGAGLPGIPLKMVLPRSRLVLLESVGKKTEFLRELVRQLGLTGVTTISGRAEEMAHRRELREQFNLVVARAVAKMPALVELTMPFCKVGGIVVAQKKGDIAEEIEQSRAGISLLGGRLRDLKKLDLPGLSADRYLVIIDKVETTSGKFPRRNGVPAKKPLTWEDAKG